MIYTAKDLDRISDAIQLEFNKIVEENKYTLSQSTFSQDAYKFYKTPSVELLEAYTRMLDYDSYCNEVKHIIKDVLSIINFNTVTEIAEKYKVLFDKENKSNLNISLFQNTIERNFTVTPPEKLQNVFSLSINDTVKHYYSPHTYLLLNYKRILSDFYPNVDFEYKHDINITVNDRNYLVTPDSDFELKITTTDIVSISIDLDCN